MKKQTTKTVIILLMIFQVALTIVGIYDLINCNIAIGLFGVIVNPIFFVVNIYNLKRL